MLTTRPQKRLVAHCLIEELILDRDECEVFQRRALKCAPAELAGGFVSQRLPHYSWEMCRDPAAREAELLRDYQESFGRAPKLNAG